MSKIFVANWKANITTAQMREWVAAAKEGLEKSGNEIIVCPSFASLEVLAWELRESSVKIGGQSVSHFPSGSYTGEVTAEMLSGVANYCIVGHSERKKYFGETEEQINEKVKQLLEKSINPILCVADSAQLDRYLNNYSDIKGGEERIIFVYEPPTAISGGGDFHPESAENAAKIIAEFKVKIGQNAKVLYGGSVNNNVIASFLKESTIDGFLVGKASLSPQDFLNLVSASGR